ncbi:Major facilitator superfamily domain, general substrate transporter [Penicillium expansum]|uniref:Major facilitator superfamily domain, general substrate transporter n=1 Tax=Penicillium expansum TaxID=27334 RepID=A0A0A2KCF9_PENEN|nr:Major facilitator superfamily domain, general substrate transporter [Penicillium expansum]KGO62045.1 Major facilitator superfamily domain, general substrate transporter [Penicillium expansum]
MSYIDETLTHSVPILSSIEQQNLSGKEPIAAVGSQNEKFVEQPLVIPVGDSNLDFVLVNYEENDPENPLNWSSMKKWLIVFAISWMGFVSVFSTMTITPTAPQILQVFHSHNKLDQTLLVTIWELGEGIGPFFIAPLSERFGRLPVFHIGNFLALCCLIACALSVNIPMLIAFRFLTGCFLSILTLGPTIMIADFISPVAGAYIAHDLGWRWSIWLAVIVLGFFSLFLLAVLREIYAVVNLRRKAERLQKESTDGKTYRSKYQAHVDASTIFESVMKPLQILAQSPIIILTTSYMAVTYALVSLILATITETMESTYPAVFNSGSVGLTFLGLAIGNTIALIFYSLTSDRYVIHQQKKNGNAFKPES